MTFKTKLAFSNFSPIFLNLFILICLVACGPKSEHIVLNAVKNPESVLIDPGVWINIPDNYVRANSYEGYQLQNRRSSISVTTSRKSIDQVKAAFDKANLKRKKTELLELSTVDYNGNLNAFFAKVHDQRKNTIRYLLAINNGEITYNIKAFCYFDDLNFFDQKLKASLLSTYLAPFEEKEAAFKRVSSNGKDLVVFTRDGKNPTESPDEAIIKISQIDVTDEISVENKRASKVLKSMTGEKEVNVEWRPIENGRYFFGSSEYNNKTAYVFLIAFNDETGTLIQASGNEQINAYEFKDWIHDKFLQTTIGFR